MTFDAKQLYDTAEKNGLVSALAHFGKNINISIPYSDRFSGQSIDALDLSVRSRNGLMRAGVDTIDKLIAVLSSEQGLAAIRNLGRKSISEIKTALTVRAYDRLSERSKRAFWVTFLEENKSA